MIEYAHPSYYNVSKTSRESLDHALYTNKEQYQTKYYSVRWDSG